jgi:hypothetical protein
MPEQHELSALLAEASALVGQIEEATESAFAQSAVVQEDLLSDLLAGSWAVTVSKMLAPPGSRVLSLSLLEDLRADRLEQVKTRPTRVRRAEGTVMDTTKAESLSKDTIMGALARGAGVLSPEELFLSLSATEDDVEPFFMLLRQAVQDGLIEIRRPDDTTVSIALA